MRDDSLHDSFRGSLEGQIVTLHKRKIVEWLLWLVAIIIGTTLFLQLGDAAFYQRGARQKLLSSASTSPAATRAPGEPIALLDIPRLEMSVVVGEGTDSSTLRRGAGRLSSGADLGQGGNLTIAAHRDTFFRPLESIQEGDRILVETAERLYTYQVIWTMIVRPENLAVTAPTESPALTLVTCYPFRFVGSAPERFVVRAALAESVAKQTST